MNGEWLDLSQNTAIIIKKGFLYMSFIVNNHSNFLRKKI